MDYRGKLEKIPDETIYLEAFSHLLPKGFRGTSSEEEQMAIWLPGLKSPEKWEDKLETFGVKVMIEEKIEIVRSRVLAAIGHRLGKSYPEATFLSRELLPDTLTFLIDSSDFIITLFWTLRLAGFDKTTVWTLVSAVDWYWKRGMQGHAVSRRVWERIFWGWKAKKEQLLRLPWRVWSHAR